MTVQCFGRFVTDGKSRAYVEADKALINYYGAILPKYKPFQPQKYPPHITVIRAKYEVLTDNNWALLFKFNGIYVYYTYNTTLMEDNKYYYLDAWSITIGGFRTLVGLPQYRNDRSSYHITIGNKALQNESYPTRICTNERC